MVDAGATTYDEVLDRLPGDSQAGPEVVHVRRKGRAIAAVHIDLGAGIGDAIHRIGCVGIEVFEAVGTLVAPAEDVPAEASGDGE